jgi:hypothetical protein
VDVELQDAAAKLCQWVQSSLPLLDEPRGMAELTKSLSKKIPFVLNVILRARASVDWAKVDAQGRVVAQRPVPSGALVTVFPVDLLMLIADDSLAAFNCLQGEEKCVVRKTFMRPEACMHTDQDMKESGDLAQQWHAFGREVAPGVLVFGNPKVHPPDACGHMIPAGKSSNCALTFLAHGVMIAVLATRDIPQHAQLVVT